MSKISFKVFWASFGSKIAGGLKNFLYFIMHSSRRQENRCVCFINGHRPLIARGIPIYFVKIFELGNRFGGMIFDDISFLSGKSFVRVADFNPKIFSLFGGRKNIGLPVFVSHLHTLNFHLVPDRRILINVAINSVAL